MDCTHCPDLSADNAGRSLPVPAALRAPARGLAAIDQPVALPAPQPSSCSHQPLSNSALSGITRDSVLTLARHLGLTVIEQAFPREMLYIADEVFFSGTAAEVSPIRSIDRIVIGDGKVGEITKTIADEFFGIANGLKPDRFGWLTPVRVNASEPVGA